MFLDEVGELAPDAQAMLLWFLGDGEIRAVGEGRFREDLYYRLRRVVLTVPPLRARLDDLPLLVEHVRRQVTVRHGLRIDGVTEEALRGLAAYPWTGNVRELGAALEEAMLLRGRSWLRAEDVALPAPMGDRWPLTAPLASIPTADARRQRVLALAANLSGVSTSQLARATGVGPTRARGRSWAR